MFTVNIKGKANPKNPEFVKLEMVLFKTGYPRVTKVVNLSGPIKDWDATTQQFKGRGTETTERNKRLLELKTSYLNVAEDWEAEGKVWSPVQWSHCFDAETKEKDEKKVVSIDRAFDMILEMLQKRERIKNGIIITSTRTANQYRYVRKPLEEFVQSKYGRSLSSMYFTDITEQFIEDFIFFSEKQGIEQNHTGNVRVRMRLLRGIVYYAKQLGIADTNCELFEKARPKCRPKKFEPKTIPLALLRKIENIDRSLFSRLEQFHIDLFLFSFYTGGMASVDVGHLTWDCIGKDGRLNYERIKYSKQASIVFHPKARAIAEKYKEKCFGNYVLPILTHKHTTELKQHNGIEHVQKSTNKTLRKLTNILQHKEPITWYSARGTFITTMIAENVHPAIVAEMAGNSAKTIFKHYFKNTTRTEIDSQVLAKI